MCICFYLSRCLYIYIYIYIYIWVCVYVCVLSTNQRNILIGLYQLFLAKLKTVKPQISIVTLKDKKVVKEISQKYNSVFYFLFLF